ncbi:hypothetical protein MRX96_047830 [Rhipicephalus microplus]
MMGLCALTDELAQGVDALLTPGTRAKLKETRSELREFGVKIVRAEQNTAEEIDHADEIDAKEKPVHQPDPTGF